MLPGVAEREWGERSTGPSHIQRYYMYLRPALGMTGFVPYTCLHNQAMAKDAKDLRKTSNANSITGFGSDFIGSKSRALGLYSIEMATMWLNHGVITGLSFTPPL